MICEIIVGQQYQGGITTIEIDEIVASYGNKEGVFVFADNNTFDVFINGEISIVGVRAIDQSGNETNVFAYNQDITIEVEFSNPTGYQINAIETNHCTFSSLSVVDEQTVRFTYNLGIGARLLEIEEFKYTKI